MYTKVKVNIAHICYGVMHKWLTGLGLTLVECTVIFISICTHLHYSILNKLKYVYTQKKVQRKKVIKSKIFFAILFAV